MLPKGFRHGPMTTIALILAGLLGAVQIAGCSGPRWKGLGVLLSDTGEEAAAPTVRLRDALRRMSEPERASVIDDLLETLDGPGEYSRLVAAEVLLRYFESRPETMTDKAARILAKNLLRIAGQPRILRAPPGWFLASDDLMDNDEAMVRPIAPRTVIEVDIHDISLRHGLPKGWRAENGRVEVDGKVVLERAYSDGMVPYELVLPKTYLDPARVMGKHRLVARLEIVAPCGTRVPLEQVVEFEIIPEEQFWRAGD